MQINGLFLRLSVVSILFTTVVLADSTFSGSLKSGDEIVLIPKDQHALSITRAAGRYASDSNFDFIMMNKHDLVYEDKNQKDDIYLVFHDDIEPGDSIKIHINRGYFDYKIAPIYTLPNIVKNVLEEGVVERSRIAPKKKTKPQPKRKTRPKMTPKKETLKSAPKNEILSAVALPVQEKIAPAQTTQPALKSSTLKQSPLSDGFFDEFTKIFEGLVKSFSMTPSVKKSPVKQEVKKVAKTQKSKGITKSFDDSALQKSASMQARRFVTAPKRGIKTSFDDSALKREAQTQKKVFSAAKEIPVNTYIPATVEQKFAGRGSVLEKAYHDRLPQQAEKVPSFRGVAPIPMAPEAGTMIEPEPAVVASRTVEAPAFVEQPQSPRYATVSAPVQIREEYQAPNNVAYPDTGYKKGYESLDNRPKELQHQRVVEDTRLPSAPAVSEGEEKKLVITKTIDKQEPVSEDPYAGRVLGSIDDRVLGNGYDGASSSGKLKMRVTKNAKPVAAWIEVFKNGTKERVKTFYTSKGSAKSVKLPAGTYMVRATYRTRGSKQQKTLNNIHLKEGGSISKSIAFHDGKLRVIARRGDAAMYVKVVAYKSGTRDRVAYDFSSRTSGIAELSLGSGTYDIEVIDHENSRPFEGIRIRGGKMETINADF